MPEVSPSSHDISMDEDSSLVRNPAPNDITKDPNDITTDLSPEGRGLLHTVNNNNNNTNSKEWAPIKAVQSVTMAPNHQLTYLDRVVMEIIETERMYVRDLRMIVESTSSVCLPPAGHTEDYLSHIIDQCELSIRPEQVCSLFGNIEDIYEFNSELLQALDLCDRDPVAVARCFVLKSEYFEIYTQYCTNYPNSVAALTECMRNKSLAKFFRERQAVLKRSLPLGSYLLKPVQRILKYHLLLQEIAKHFDPEEAGYEVVEEAIYTMTGVAWYINDMKRKHEHAVRLQEVQSLLLNWKGSDLTTFGEMVLEGTFKVHRAKNERTLFLFERMLLLTKRRGEHYVYKTHITCSTLMLIESAKDSLSFSVTHYKHPKQPHTVQAKTVEEKKLWAHHIKRIILENHHAIIPQKAKDAILEMNSIYPPRYRYSPERLKKALSLSEPSTENQKNNNSSPLDPTDVIKECEGDSESDLFFSELDDFTASVLAAITALLSAGVSLVTEADGDSNKVQGQVPAEDKPVGTGPTCEQPSTDHLPQEKISEPTEKPPPEEPPRSDRQAELPPCTTPDDSDSRPPSSGESSEEEEEEKDQSEDAQTGSRHSSSSSSILPSSVLDKASAIAQHFSIRRGSSSREDPHSPRNLAHGEALSPGCASPLRLARQDATSTGGCVSPRSVARNEALSPDSATPWRPPSRTGSMLSPSMSDRASRLSSVGSGHPADTDLASQSPHDEDSLFDGEQGITRWKRRDSTLSKHDQILIGKIRSYYETAESEDVSFRLQRRESLTYIPTGLVRSSVSRFNSIPNDQHTGGGETADTDPSISSVEPQGDMLLTEPMVFLESSQTTSKDLEEQTGDKPDVPSTCQDAPDEEFFRPSSEMIQIWQKMERDVTTTPQRTGAVRSREALRNARAIDTPNRSSDLGTISEESSGASPLKPRAGGGGQAVGGRPRQAPTLLDTHLDSKTPNPHTKAPNPQTKTPNPQSRAPNPQNKTPNPHTKAPNPQSRAPNPQNKTPNPHTKAPNPQSRDPNPNTKTPNPHTKAPNPQSKVLNLARQYSQRMKPSAPPTGRKTLSCVMEEKESAGKPSLSVALPGPVLEQSSLPVLSQGGVSPGPTTPNTPTALQGFIWPDVRQLRSRYSDHARPKKTPIWRRKSTPERVFYAPSSLLTPGASYSEEEGEEGEVPVSKPLKRTHSLGARLSAASVAELEDFDCDGYYVAAAASLPHDPEHRVMVVMEKLPEPSEEPDQDSKDSTDPKDVNDSKIVQEEKVENKEDEDNYIQIHSPTSKEKICFMPVVERCRLYQDSEESKTKPEAPAQTSPHLQTSTDPSHRHTDNPDFSASSSSPQKAEAGQQSIVKNLREKFQSLS